MTHPQMHMASRVRDQSGIGLVELIISMAVMSLVMVVFGTVLASVQRTVVHSELMSQANDQARLALQQLDREVRSGNVLYEASSGGFSVKVYTQANLNTRGQAVCKEWEVTTAGELRVVTWTPGATPDPSTAVIVASDVVNRQLSPVEPAFQLDPDPLKKSRTLIVTFAINPDLADKPGQTLRVRESLTGRNTSYGYPVGICQ